MSDTTIVADFYNKNAEIEKNRLVDGKLEFAVTLKTILASLPKGTSLRIADIGGGTGPYAMELTKLGHKVTLSDISLHELELAAENAKAAKLSFEAIICADASKLLESAFSEGDKFDVVLLLGPLYHLLGPEERIAALSACAALTKPNGMVFASFVTRFGHLRDMARRDPGRLTREAEFYKDYLENGKYDRRKDCFSHHTHPTEIMELLRGIPELSVESLVACESFLGFASATGLNSLSENEFQDWVEVALRFAGDPCALGASEHILAVTRRI